MQQKTVTAKQIQDLDRIAIGRYGVPSLALMENAGRAVAQEVLRRVRRVRRPRVCVVCGLGNNAGDGFVIARHLINAGVNTKIFLAGRGSKLKADAAINYKILKKLKYPIHEAGARRVMPLLRKEITRADAVVDAIFGVGLNREVGEPFRSVIETVNAHARRVVAVDVPSGLDATTGDIYGVCVRAAATVTFSFAKKGFFRRQGPKHAGKVIVVDIGIPVRLMRQV